MKIKIVIKKQIIFIDTIEITMIPKNIYIENDGGYYEENIIC